MIVRVQVPPSAFLGTKSLTCKGEGFLLLYKCKNLNKSSQVKLTQTSQKPVTTQTKPAQTQAKPTQDTQTKPTQTSSQTQSAPTPKVETPVETKPVYNPNSQTMLKYKGELRSALFRKLPVGSIQGSGACAVQFSVDSTGKLINRSFAQQSDNKSLNDAVYYMMMSVPKFNPPPSEYNGSLIKMYIKFNNGSYEISIY